MSTLPRLMRCAIYTRKSTEHGLELEFNSLDAQRAACEAYIKSQASLGWKTTGTHYDDAAYSGGSLERPALQKLLTDIKAGRIDVVMVYKIDRLTRSLIDFAKLVEIFDARSVSFVAVTQQFNTTTSMGRLTLNVLLSFAQFERELASERVRDKIFASRKKGKWMGGSSPFGYRAKDKKLHIDQTEAKIIRYVFERYLEIKNLRDLLTHLHNKKIPTRNRGPSKAKNGKKPFSRGGLAHLLKNRIYIGEVYYKGEHFAGEHPPILDRLLFDSVQKLLKANSVVRQQKRANNLALFTGLIFDDRGNRMTPSHTVKNGVRYRFYICSALLNGRSGEAGTVRRISAPNLEKAIIALLRSRLSDPISSFSDRELVEKFIDKIVLHTNTAEIIRKERNCSETDERVLEIPLANILNRTTASLEGNYDSPDPKIINVIAKAHLHLRMLTHESYASIESLASAMKVPPRAIRSSLRWLFLAPDIVESLLKNRAHKIENIAKFQNALPISWNKQRVVLTAQNSTNFSPK